ncbi:heme-binding protein [Sphingobacterium siyangense]
MRNWVARLTVVTGGFPLIINGKVIGAIGVGGGTENQDREIGEY